MRRLLIKLIVLLVPLSGFTQTPIWRVFDSGVNNSVVGMCGDEKGLLWLATGDQFLQFNGSDWTFFPGISKDFGTFSAIQSDTSGNLLAGTSNGQFLRFSRETSRWEELPLMMDYAITAIVCPDPAAKCALISYGNGVRLKFGSIDTFLTVDNHLVSNEAYEGVFDGEQFYLATDQGLQLFSFEQNSIRQNTFNQQSGLTDMIITNVALFQDEIWVANFDMGVDVITKDQGIINYPLDKKTKINDLSISEYGAFLSTDEGLYFLEDEGWILRFPESGKDRVENISVSSDGNICIVNREGELIVGSSLLQKDLSFEQPIQALIKSGKSLWVGNERGLFRLSDGKEESLLERNITSLVKDEDQLIWAGTYSEGFYVLDSTGRIVYHLSAWDGVEAQSVLSIFASNGKALVSSLTGVIQLEYEWTSGKGINIINVENLNRWLGLGYVYQINSFTSGLVFALDRDGLKLWDGHEVTHIEYFEDGDKLESVFSVFPDKKGRIWFASINGLGYIEENSIKKFRNADKKRVYTSLIGVNDTLLLMLSAESVDLLNTETGQQLSFEKEIQNETGLPFLNTYDIDSTHVWFAHDNHIYRLLIKGEISMIPELVLDSVLMNLEKIDGHRFRQHQNNFQFHVTGIWMTTNDDPVFEFMLEGFEKEWRQTRERIISYSRLPPGNYTFRIRAAVDGHFDYSKEESYVFKIRRHFYRTVWFWITGGALFLGLFIVFISYQKQREIRQLSIEQKHISSQLEHLKSQLNPHFLFNSFNTLMGLIEEDEKGKSLQFVEQLTDFYRMILEYGKSTLVNIDDELKHVNLYIDLLNVRFNDAIRFNIADDLPVGKIPPLTLQLLIENVVKHNEVDADDPININFYAEDGWFIFSNTKKLKKFRSPSSGSGLANIEKRYQLLISRSIIVEENNHKFTVYLPIISSKEEG